MGRTANLSPMGLYNWDPTIFDLLVLPEALDRDTFINNLLLETAELEVLYTSPVTFRYAVGQWSHKELDVWERLYATTQYEYNPIDNYNRYEHEADTGMHSTVQGGTDTTGTTTSHTGSDTTTVNRTGGGSEASGKSGNSAEGGNETVNMKRAQTGADIEHTNSELAAGGGDTVTGSETKGHFVAGFDAPTPTPTDNGLVKQTRDETDNTTTTTYGKTETGTSDKATAYGKSENNEDATTFGKTIRNGEVGATVYDRTENASTSTEYGTTNTNTEETTYGKQEASGHANSRDLYAHGNIGVTTTQKLIREQRDIEKFNLYNYILDSFKMRFCVLVY